MKYVLPIRKRHCASPLAFLQNLLMSYVVYMFCRIVFVWENWSLYGDTLFENNFWSLLSGSLKFDTSAIFYTHIIYALMMLFPCHLKEKQVWQKAAKWVYVTVNSIAVVMNLCDAVYVQFTGRRSTITVFSEFSNENNLGGIIGTEILRHWYLVLLGVGMMYAMWKLYRMPSVGIVEASAKESSEAKQCGMILKDIHIYYLLHVVSFAVYIPLTIAAMRGGFTTAVRPITISNAHQYVEHPSDATVVLNTPFSFIRTIGKTTFPIPGYFQEAELDAIYTPVHSIAGGSSEDIEQNITLYEQPSTQTVQDTSQNAQNSALHQPSCRKNVVILIVESFGREFIGAYNESLDGGNYRGYTPFVDSLYQHCLSFDYTFANGRKSIDGMPSILASIPMFIEPFVLTPASMNKVSGIAGELGKKGYSSAFFHGAENGSMGFQAFARNSGFKQYYGRTEFNQDTRFRGDKDFDGTWAIWDEPFLQFYALKMSEMHEPFVTSVFTASSHHPFAVPAEYARTYPEEGSNPLHKCIRYTDHALREFFETAKSQPWYNNTIFVLTSDHTNQPDHAQYKTDLGLYGAPILFFDPSGTLIPAGRRHCIAEQIDIMPSVLGLLGYDQPYVAFGQDLFHTSDTEMRAVHYNNGIYQFVKGDWMLQFDGETTKALYNYKNDWMQQHNEKGKHAGIQSSMEKELKAIIQSYMTRMNKNQLVHY